MQIRLSFYISFMFTLMLFAFSCIFSCVIWIDVLRHSVRMWI